MIKGVTATGFAYELDPAALEDYYVIEQFGLAQKGDLLAFGVLLEKMLGAKQKTALLKHCEDENGRAPVSKVSDEIASIYRYATEASKKAKNS